MRACSSFPDGEGITLRLISHSPPGKEPIICCHCFRMTVTQYIENLYDRLKDHLHEDYLDLYPVPTTSSLRLGSVFSTLHHNFLESFKLMNSRLPTGETCGVHFWADASRDLIALIDQTEELQTTLKSTELAFSLEPYYLNVIEQCKDFLSPSGGSTIPPQMRKIELYYTQPIFLLKNTISLGRGMEQTACELKLIGEGSYAQVFRYRDLNYDKYFVLKRAKANLNDKELERFKREFEQMKGLNSPYVVEVYRYDDEKKEYLMESMDDTLFHYIQKNNTKLPEEKRKNLCRQVLRAFSHIHAKGLLHRDISPTNILIKEYEHLVVAKVSDFGLVHLPDSNLTTCHTEFKGYFNDPVLRLDGFDSYDIQHETYALTRLIFYIMTGKTNTDRISEGAMKAFLQKGLHSNRKERFQNVGERQQALKTL